MCREPEAVRCQLLVTVCVPPVTFQRTCPPGLMLTLAGTKEMPLAETTAESAAPDTTVTVPVMPMFAWNVQW
jgi:hypothetical protein